MNTKQPFVNVHKRLLFYLNIGKVQKVFFFFSFVFSHRRIIAAFALSVGEADSSPGVRAKGGGAAE